MQKHVFATTVSETEFLTAQRIMKIRPGILIAILAVFGVLIGGRYLGWFGGNATPPAVTAGNGEPSTKPLPPIEVEPPAPRPEGRSAKPPMIKPGGIAVVTTPAPPVDATGPITDWEQRIDELLTGSDDEALKAKKMLAMFPRLPEDGKVEAAQHISNLLPDDQFAELAKLLLDPKMPEEVLEVLMTDVLNRPNGIKLDALFDLAKLPNHPKAEEARDVLEVFLDDVDWDAVKASGDWEPVRQIKDKFKAENPDE
jgi:hypothetical protein